MDRGAEQGIAAGAGIEMRNMAIFYLQMLAVSAETVRVCSPAVEISTPVRIDASR